MLKLTLNHENEPAQNIQKLPDLILFQIFTEILKQNPLALLDLATTSKLFQSKINYFLETRPTSSILLEELYKEIILADPSENKRLKNNYGCVPGFTRNSYFTPSSFLMNTNRTMKSEFTSVMKMSQKWQENVNFTYSEHELANLVEVGRSSKPRTVYSTEKRVVGFCFNDRYIFRILQVKKVGKLGNREKIELLLVVLNLKGDKIKETDISKMFTERIDLVKTGGKKNLPQIQMIVEKNEPIVWIPMWKKRLVRYKLDTNYFFEFRYQQIADIKGMPSAVDSYVSYDHKMEKRLIFGTTAGQVYLVFYDDTKTCAKLIENELANKRPNNLPNSHTFTFKLNYKSMHFGQVSTRRPETEEARKLFNEQMSILDCINRLQTFNDYLLVQNKWAIAVYKINRDDAPSFLQVIREFMFPRSVSASVPPDKCLMFGKDFEGNLKNHDFKNDGNEGEYSIYDEFFYMPLNDVDELDCCQLVARSDAVLTYSCENMLYCAGA